MAVHTASIWPWFSVNELFYIFVILYKREKRLFKKRQSGYIGYVCILVIPLSLGTDISSNKSDFSTNIHSQTETRLKAFLPVRKLFILIYKLEKCLVQLILKGVLEGGCCEEWPLLLFVILDAVLCALKCIFVLIDNLLWHISTIFLLI